MSDQLTWLQGLYPNETPLSRTLDQTNTLDGFSKNWELIANNLNYFNYKLAQFESSYTKTPPPDQIMLKLESSNPANRSVVQNAWTKIPLNYFEIGSNAILANAFNDSSLTVPEGKWIISGFATGFNIGDFVIRVNTPSGYIYGSPATSSSTSSAVSNISGIITVASTPLILSVEILCSTTNNINAFGKPIPGYEIIPVKLSLTKIQ